MKELQPGYQFGLKAARRASSDTEIFEWGCSDILVLDLRNYHRGIPALPFCHVSIKGNRPLPKAYPRELKTIGDHIRKKRLDLKLHQYEVAPIIGVNKTTIFNWERNYSSPKLRHIPKIIEFLGYIPFEVESESLGKRIVNYRRLVGMTQKDLARKLGVDPTTLARWERDEKSPQNKYIEKSIVLLRSFIEPIVPQ